MAITDRNGRWYLDIPGPNGTKTQKTFSTYGRAKAWETRNAAATARYANVGPAPDALIDTLGDALERYGREVSTLKKGALSEGYRVAQLSRAPIAALTLACVTTKAIADYRNERLAVVSNSTVRNELSILRRTLETARREWGYDLPSNAAHAVTLPPIGASRDRRLRDGEYEALERELADNPAAWAFVRFAIETAMRRGEILALTWEHVYLAQGVVHITDAKNGSPRRVPLTDGALEVLEGLKRNGKRVFPIDPHALRWAWCEALRRAGIKDLRLHDLRHEGCSRLFELGLTLPEVSMISGHKTASQLLKYTHPDARSVRRKLEGRRPRS